MKRFKTKKHINIKSKLIILIASIIFLIIFIIISFQKLNSNYNSLIDILLKDVVINKSDASNINLSLNLDYLITNHSFKKKDKITYSDNQKMIYLYNTHDLETYGDGKSVYDANIELSKNLNRLGINVLVETKKTSNYLSTGLSYYNISRSFITNVQNKDILFYIDIHRDSVTDTISIDNKGYAKVLFVLGLDNPSYLENKKIMEQMNNFLNTNYPGISKGILEKQGEGVDGVYNQDINKNVLLIEVGGVDSLFTEIKNTTEVLSLMLYHIIHDNNM